MNEFMVLVERAVRPVTAGPRRKMRMREELFAHLTGIYEQELARLGDEAAARQEAVRRFGDSAGLTAELQGSVTLQDRVDARLDRWFGWRPGESLVRYLFRLAGLGCLLVLPFLVVGLIVAGYRRPADPTVPTAAQLVVGWTTFAAFGTVWLVSAGWLAIRLRGTVYGVAPSRIRAAGYTVLLTLLTPVVCFGFYAVVLADVPSGLTPIVRTDTPALVVNVAATVLFPVIMLWAAREWSRRTARRAEWAAVQIA